MASHPHGKHVGSARRGDTSWRRHRSGGSGVTPSTRARNTRARSSATPAPSTSTRTHPRCALTARRRTTRPATSPPRSTTPKHQCRSIPRGRKDITARAPRSRRWTGTPKPRTHSAPGSSATRPTRCSRKASRTPRRPSRTPHRMQRIANPEATRATPREGTKKPSGGTRAGSPCPSNPNAASSSTATTRWSHSPRCTSTARSATGSWWT